MANFSTHLVGGILLSATTAMFVVQADAISPVRGLLLTAVGALGGLLPDIDAENSIPARWIRAILSSAVAIITGAVLWPTQSLLAIVTWSLVTMIVFNVICTSIVRRLTMHRGMIHSIPFAALVGGLAIILGQRGFGMSDREAWYTGAFLMLGFLGHLVLDEVASVELTSVRVKRSFGSALKLWSTQSRIGTLLVYSALTMVILSLPSPTEFLRELAETMTVRTSTPPSSRQMP